MPLSGLASRPRVDRDLHRLRLGRRRQGDCQYAVLDLRLDGLRVDVADWDLPVEVAGHDLLPDIAIARGLLLLAVLGADREHAISEGDVELLGLETGQRSR